MGEGLRRAESGHVSLSTQSLVYRAHSIWGPFWGKQQTTQSRPAASPGMDGWSDHRKSFPAPMSLEDSEDKWWCLSEKTGSAKCCANESGLTPKSFDEQLNQGGLSGDGPPGVTSLLTLTPTEAGGSTPSTLCISQGWEALAGHSPWELKLGESPEALSFLQKEKPEVRLVYRGFI